MGPLVFLSSADGDVGELLDLPQGFQGTFRGSGGKVEFLSRRHSRKRPQLALSGDSPGFSRVARVPLELRLGIHGQAHWGSGSSSFHASRELPLGIPQQSMPRPRSSTGVEAGNSGFLYRADMDLGFFLGIHMGVRPRLVWSHASPLSSRARNAVSGFQSVDPRNWWFSLQVPQGCHTCHRVVSQSSV